MVGVVAAQMLRGVQGRLLPGIHDVGIDPGPGRVSGAIFTVRSSREQGNSVQRVRCRISRYSFPPAGSVGFSSLSHFHERGQHELLVATVACKAAVKAGEPLAPDEMQALFRALLSTTLPAHDVHGRSGIIRLTWDELDRRFGRK